MVKKQLIATSFVLGIPFLSLGCGEQATETNTEDVATAGSGMINLMANGEDFVREGFVSKDGWRIDFDHAYVTLDEVVAYQSDPPFDPDEQDSISANEEVTLVDEPTTIDLAEGGADADLIEVTEKESPAGGYNALAWQVVSPEEGESNSAISLQGTAQKDGETINFTLNLDRPLSYECGEYVGDDRKGFLEADSQTQLETTFHFDHIFGDSEAPEDDGINTGAVGFEPMAALAEDETVDVDLATLEQELSSQDYETLEKAIVGLGHVGEGHCNQLES
ncbi:MAG: DUF4382 domain-containing protein [Halothece sp.]